MGESTESALMFKDTFFSVQSFDAATSLVACQGKLVCMATWEISGQSFILHSLCLWTTRKKISQTSQCRWYFTKSCCGLCLNITTFFLDFQRIHNSACVFSNNVGNLYLFTASQVMNLRLPVSHGGHGLFAVENVDEKCSKGQYHQLVELTSQPHAPTPQKLPPLSLAYAVFVCSQFLD